MTSDQTEAGARLESQKTPDPKTPIGTKLAYGFGAAAFGIKENGFSYFLLIFYSQVVGLDARLVGLAAMIALVVDAISDPIVGYVSDNFRSKWGRRHPFMYAAALPVSISYYFLWNPPANWEGQNLFLYLLALAIIIRTFITLYETPSSALGAELTDNYDERSSLLSFRFFFAWVGGNFMSVLNFFVLFPAFATAVITNGQFNREAYQIYGLISAILIFAAIMVSSLGTHSHIPHLRPAPPKRQMTLPKIFKEIFQTLSEPSFMALFCSALFGAVASGLTASLAFYFTTYFWGFSSQQTGFVVLGVFISAILGSILAPIITRKLGKKRGALLIGAMAFIGSPLPIVLRLTGIMPPNDDPATFWIYFFANMVDTSLIICFQILVSSMIADLVEQTEVRTNRRSEGVLFSAATFIRKSVQGIGLMAASGVLYLAQIEAGSAPEDVSSASVYRLGLFYVPIVLSIWLAMMSCIAFYKLDRSSHEENLRALKER